MKPKPMLLLIVWLLNVTLCSAADEKPKPLTNQDVLKMLAAKLPESVILAKIQGSEVKFDISTDAIIELNKQGVSERVLVAILTPKPASPDGKDANPKPVQQTKSTNAPPPTVPASGDKSSTGPLVTAAQVKKGVTTQLELIEAFGAPNLTTTDKDGTEVWMYDKQSSTRSTEGSSKQTRKNEASAMAAFLGIPFVAGVGGVKSKGKEDLEQEGKSTVTSSVKTFTFIIKFNAAKTVKDYALRQSSY